MDAAIGSLATPQGGFITRPQLLSIGLNSSSIDKRIQAGRLIRAHRGVYAVGHLPTDDVSRCKGALLAAGPRSAVAFNSAGAYWGMRKRHPVKPQVWVAAIGIIESRVEAVLDSLSRQRPAEV